MNCYYVDHPAMLQHEIASMTITPKHAQKACAIPTTVIIQNINYTVVLVA